MSLQILDKNYKLLKNKFMETFCVETRTYNNRNLHKNDFIP